MAEAFLPWLCQERAAGRRARGDLADLSRWIGEHGRGCGAPMGRKVFVSSDMATDERLLDVASASPGSALLWPWILTCFDDWGRAEASARSLKHRVFPAIATVTVADVESALEAFARSGLILLYTVHDKRYMAIPADKWWRYQTQIPKSKRGRDESRVPPPPEGPGPGAGPEAGDGTDTEDRGLPRGSAQHSAIARNGADPRGIPLDLSPSPSPSPSPSYLPSAGTPAAGPAAVPGGVAAPPDHGPEPRAPQDIPALARQAYDRARAAGWTPSSQRWLPGAIGRMKALTPQARAEVPEAVAWAAAPGRPGHVRTWLARCELVPLMEAWRSREELPPSRASPPRGGAPPQDQGLAYRDVTAEAERLTREGGSGGAGPGDPG